MGSAEDHLASGSLLVGGLQRAKQAGMVPLTQLEVGGTEGLLVDVDFPNPTEKVSFKLSEISC